ncbi:MULTISPECIES: cobalt ECF transporter T component CbiQ [Methanobacterium]|uniref:Cobalt transporter n=1 Tax=Methanobacterium bryantii TaxID=2161 RepID=A0A2A2H306_METBR|nr:MULTISPECIES: cobalt ECF transporter T component CbiQ [Methanobacterium]OEC86017.1 cobalt ECF transporter T component CbiQ [Methanobacterium sp. A39]PAV03735.1 cobalt transporter [Methanobacterium bryantii]
MNTNSILNLENETMKESFLHLLDGRIKLVILVFITIYAVYTTEPMILVLLEVYLLLLIYLSQISFKTTLKRVLLLLPFGGLIIVFQPFIHPGNVMYALPFGINVTHEGLTFGILLMSRLIVSLTAIVLLSSISPMQEVVQSFRKLGMPKEFAMIFSLMIRFLFMFFDELDAIRNAQATRNFDIFNKKTPYMWRMKQIGYTIMMMFLRAYERGETVYLSMVSRGYSDKSQLYNDGNKNIGSKEYVFTGITVALVICLEIAHYFLIV